jgi:hypothetical protein
MEFKNINFKKGFFRSYLVVWCIWLFIFAADGYKEILTVMGFNYWHAEVAQKRNFERCLEEKKSGTSNFSALSNDCVIEKIAFSAEDIVLKNSSNKKVYDIFIFGLIFPSFFGVFILVLFFLGKWVVRGFMN